ncbi:MAG: CbtA family protein [Magnetovibrio sp.]|nr:CbtA family protein [Magnetovibrio sp.]
MMYRLFATAMAAGVLVAVLVSMVEVYTTTPLILEAEGYEVSTVIIGHVHDHSAWSPENGWERFGYTVVANVVTTISFALFLVVGLSFGPKQADRRTGFLMAIAGFAAFTLAPTMGLPPELPGMPTADLHARQMWWLATVLCTLGGLYCLFLTDIEPVKILGILIVLAPHIWGAPHPLTQASEVPATLAAHFAASSIVISAILWGLLGYFAPLFYNYFKGKEA